MARVRDFWIGAVLIVSVLLPAYFLIAAMGTKFGVLDWRVGFGAMTFIWGPRLLMAAAALAFIGLVLALSISPRRGALGALVALLIPALGLGYGFYVREQASAVPPIHDISTDLTDPPGYSQEVVIARAGIAGGNDLDLLTKRTGEGRAFVDLQREAYPDITAVHTGLDRARAFDIALALAREQGWRIGRVDAEAGVIEAQAESFWYGFIDDIVIRIRPEGDGARIDMRSVSRVGRSDLGANAARMRPYLQILGQRLQAAGG